MKIIMTMKIIDTSMTDMEKVMIGEDYLPW